MASRVVWLRLSGEFYSEDFYRHRPWLLKIPRWARMTVLILGMLALASRVVSPFFLAEHYWVPPAVLLLAALGVELVGRAVAFGRVRSRERRD